jgi:uncharacterized protein YneF (UPF0154 family)
MFEFILLSIVVGNTCSKEFVNTYIGDEMIIVFMLLIIVVTTLWSGDFGSFGGSSPLLAQVKSVNQILPPIKEENIQDLMRQSGPKFKEIASEDGKFLYNEDFCV